MSLVQYATPDLFGTDVVGGMATKRVRVVAAGRFVQLEVVPLNEIDAPVALIEPLLFRFSDSGFDEEVKNLAFLRSQGIKLILYPSEMEIIRWSKTQRAAILPLVDAITFNSAYQRNVINTVMTAVEFDAPPLFMPLTDPIPVTNHKVTPLEERRDVAFAAGVLTDEKGIIELAFALGRLQELGFETVLFGSSGFWGVADRLKDLQLSSVVGRRMFRSTEAEIYEQLGSAYYVVSCSYHDTFSSLYHEGCVNGALPLMAERAWNSELIKRPLGKEALSRTGSDADLANSARKAALKSSCFDVFSSQLQLIMEKLLDDQTSRIGKNW